MDNADQFVEIKSVTDGSTTKMSTVIDAGGLLEALYDDNDPKSQDGTIIVFGVTNLTTTDFFSF